VADMRRRRGSQEAQRNILNIVPTIGLHVDIEFSAFKTEDWVMTKDLSKYFGFERWVFLYY
jgi:hypothetical protein